MAWRKQENHKQETKAVKAALLGAGLPVVKVGHGRGTSWGWLDVTLASSIKKHHCANEAYDERGRSIGGEIVELTEAERCASRNYVPCVAGCPACVENRAHNSRAMAIIREVTGRHGDYDGDVIVQTR